MNKILRNAVLTGVLISLAACQTVSGGMKMKITESKVTIAGNTETLGITVYSNPGIWGGMIRKPNQSVSYEKNGHKIKLGHDLDSADTLQQVEALKAAGDTVVKIMPEIVKMAIQCAVPGSTAVSTLSDLGTKVEKVKTLAELANTLKDTQTK